MLYLSNYFKVNGNKDAWLNDQSLFDFVVKHVVFVKSSLMEILIADSSSTAETW